eukprot:tig00000480_g1324.t1
MAAAVDAFTLSMGLSGRAIATGTRSKLRQVALVPAGCQLWNKDIAVVAGDRFVYCSTLAICIYKIDEFRLEKIIAAFEKTITAVAVNHHDQNQIVTASVDGQIRLWDIRQEREVFSIVVGDHVPVFLDWSPHDPDTLLSASPAGIVRLWNMSRGDGRPIKDFNNVNIRVIRWAPKKANVVLAGTAEGTLALWDGQANKLKKGLFKREQEDPVVDLQWDPLSDYYAVVAYKSGSMALYDLQGEQTLFEFEPQNGGIRSVAWIPGVPGGFVTAADKVGVIRTWSASQKGPMGVIKAGKSGFQSLVFARASDRALCTFKDGSAGSYNLGKRRWEAQREGGHTETVFDCAFKPADANILATAAYDGIVRLWDVSQNRFLDRIPGADGVIYCLSWAPAGTEDEHKVLGASSTGALYVFDTQRGNVWKKHAKLHAQSTFRCAWHPSDRSLAASTSADGTCVVFKVATGEACRRYKHPRPAFGVAWNPHTPTQLATACEDGVVRVFDLSSEAPLLQLKGHTAKAFNVAWHPTLPHTLLSTSDDQTARVWNTQTGECRVLAGHTSNVRGAVWHPELPWMCITGSWDCTIRVWDVRTQACVQAVDDHHADVYGIDAHPARPFLLASVSRDTSLRFWSLADFVAPLAAFALARLSLDPALASQEAAMRPGAPAVLCGAASRERARQVKAAGDDLERAALLADFFLPPDGLRELFDMARCLASGRPAAPSSRVVHAEHLSKALQSRMYELEACRNQRFAGVGAARKEDQLAQAAFLALKLGQTQRYCDLMAELGQWERALAVAPTVSVEYWRGLCERYAAHLLAAEDEAAAAFLIASGQAAGAVEHFVQRGQLDDAFAVARVHAEGGFADLTAAIAAPRPHRPVRPRALAPPRPLRRGGGAGVGAGGGGGPALAGVALVVGGGVGGGAGDPLGALAERHFRDGNPYLAAAAHLATSNPDGAIGKLLRANELDLALLLARLVKGAGAAAADEARVLAARRLEALELWEAALEALQGLREPGAAASRVALLAARYPRPDAEAFYGKAGLRGVAHYRESAPRREAEGALREALLEYALARDHAKCAAAATRLLARVMQKEGWELREVEAATEVLACVDATALPDPLRLEVLAHCAFAGAHRAALRGYHPVASALFAAARSLLEQPGHARRRRPSRGGPGGEAGGLAGALADMSLSSLEAALREADQTVVPLGSAIPSGHNCRRLRPSAITRRELSGAELVLEDGRSVAGYGEAIMWARCNPFSPLPTGDRLYPL